MIAQPAAAATGSLAGGKWICQAHYNTGDMGPYAISHTESGVSASGVTNVDNCRLPAEIFRGYCEWDAQGGGWNLQSTPILSFDIWADKVMQIHVGLVDTTNGWNPGYGEEVADTYFAQVYGQPAQVTYGVGTIKSPDGAWNIMVGPSDKSTQHYEVDMRDWGVTLGHVGQIVFDVTCNHQADINWKISNVVVSSNGVGTPAPTVTPTPTPVATPTPTVVPTPTPTATPTPTPTINTNPNRNTNTNTNSNRSTNTNPNNRLQPQNQQPHQPRYQHPQLHPHQLHHLNQQPTQHKHQHLHKQQHQPRHQQSQQQPSTNTHTPTPMVGNVQLELLQHANMVLQLVKTSFSTLF